MKLAVDLSVWTIYCMKHIFFLKLIFFVKPGSFSSNLRTFLSNFVPTDVNALLLKSYPEDFRPILSWASSNPILGRNLSSTPGLQRHMNVHKFLLADKNLPNTNSFCSQTYENSLKVESMELPELMRSQSEVRSRSRDQESDRSTFRLWKRAASITKVTNLPLHMQTDLA